MSLSIEHVAKAATEVELNIRRSEPRDINGTTLQDAITEVWDLNRDEIEAVREELIRRGHCDPIKIQ